MSLEGNAKYYAALVVVMFFWGITWTSSKVLVSYTSALTVGYLRYTIALPLFLILLRYRGIPALQIFRKNTIHILVLSGIFGIFGSIFLRLYGLQFTTAGQASILAGFSPVGVALFAYIMHREKLAGNWGYIGFVVSFIGVVFVVGIQPLLEFNLDYLVGNIFVFIGVIGWGFFSSISKSAMKELSPIEVIAGSIFIGWICFGITILFDLDSLTSIIVTPEFLFHLFFIGVFPSFFGYILYFSSIKNIGPTRSGAFISLVPIFGVIMSVLFLDEIIYWTFMVGLILIVVGILVINSPVTRKDESTFASPIYE
jgi:drug/metabolite transporter (DMT)-like permease